MRIIITLFISVATCIQPLAAATTSVRLTLDECIALGVERSIPLQNARRGLEIARMDIREVRAQVYPSLDLNATYTRIDDVPTIPDFPVTMGRRNNYNASVTAEQLLYSGGSVKAALRLAEDYEETAAQEYERTRSDLMRRITQSFYEVLYRESAAHVAQESVRQLTAFEQQARLRYDAGTASEYEWLSARVALANERPTLIAADNALVVAKRAFRDLIMLDDDDYALDGDLESDMDVPELSLLQDHAIAHRAELLQARSQYQVAIHKRRVTFGEFLPELKAFATYGGADPSQRNPFADGWEWEWSAGLRVNWSLFDGGRRRATLRADDLAIEQIYEAIKDAERATRLEVEQTWLKLQELRETLAGTRDNVALADRALAIATARYEQGLATNLDFTDSHLALNRARLQHHHAWLGLQQAWAELQHVAGLHAAPESEP